MVFEYRRIDARTAIEHIGKIATATTLERQWKFGTYYSAGNVVEAATLPVCHHGILKSRFVKKMSDGEMSDFYFFQKNGYLTNLGILWIGKCNGRASLLCPPAIQEIRYDHQEEKVWKLLLDNYFDNPKELLEKELDDVPDWHESIFDDHLKIPKILCDSYRTEKHYRNCKSLKFNYFFM